MFVFHYFQLLVEPLSPSLIYPQHCYLSPLLMFAHPDEFNYIFSEEITVGVAQPARGQY